MGNRIFKKLAYPTSYFSDKIYVNCPKCFGIGLVSTNLGRYIVPKPLNTDSKFVCFKCEFRSQINNYPDSTLFEGIVNKKCNNCKKNIFEITKPKTRQELYSFESIKCRNCKIQNDYQVQWYGYRIDKPIDPYFNFELTLQTAIHNNFLWFYNLEHLSYIKEYVESELREDNGRYKYSLISNLPKFLIIAKNRELILRKMNKLLSEFKELIKHDT